MSGRAGELPLLKKRAAQRGGAHTMPMSHAMVRRAISYVVIGGDNDTAHIHLTATAR